MPMMILIHHKCQSFLIASSTRAHTCIGATQILFSHNCHKRTDVKRKKTHSFPTAQNKSNLVASKDIMVEIWPTLWSILARAERRRDFRNIAPMSYQEGVRKRVGVGE